MADYKITELNELTSVAAGDLLIIVDDPAGTPITKKITVANLFDYMAGMIVMWKGTVATIPSGWALCDGLNGTPDLRDKFIVGAKQDDSGVAKTNVSGSLTQTGGAATHTLTESELPAHTHAVTDPGHTHTTQRYPTTTGSSSGFTADTSMSGTLADNTLPTKSNTTGITLANTGSGSAHNNLPPYYALAFIMKL